MCGWSCWPANYLRILIGHRFVFSIHRWVCPDLEDLLGQAILKLILNVKRAIKLFIKQKYLPDQQKKTTWILLKRPTAGNTIQMIEDKNTRDIKLGNILFCQDKSWSRVAHWRIWLRCSSFPLLYLPLHFLCCFSCHFFFSSISTFNIVLPDNKNWFSRGVLQFPFIFRSKLITPLAWIFVEFVLWPFVVRHRLKQLMLKMSSFSRLSSGSSIEPARQQRFTRTDDYCVCSPKPLNHV